MTEPDVALTDYLLALETALFAAMIWGADREASSLRAPFVIFFAATSAAALAGGTVHGFFSGRRSVAGVVLWRTALLALGLAAYCTWAIGATLLLPDGASRLVKIGAAAIGFVYAVVVVAIDDRYWVAIAHYLPPALFLLVALGAAAVQHPNLSMASGVAGLVLTFAAAIVQRRKIALHTAYFNHNALYHAIQAVAMLLIFMAAIELIST